MSKYKYTSAELQFNKVLKYQSDELKKIKLPMQDTLNKSIAESTKCLNELGVSTDNINDLGKQSSKQKVIVVPSYKRLCEKAEKANPDFVELQELFTPEELDANSQAIKILNEQFTALYTLDKTDMAISAAAALLGALVELLAIGIPHKTPEGLKGGPLSNYIRAAFDKKFANEKMQRLAELPISQVPYDAQDNRNTTEYVNGLSAYYHRLLSVGHDPVLGFMAGVADIMRGSMTTIDKTGKIAIQTVAGCENRKETDLFAAIAKQVLHLKTDVSTSMGLPAPFMCLFNLLQFGSIGQAEQTIAEIVQGMYFEGYDFIHFCTLSLSTMLIEVVVRLCYAIKKLKGDNNPALPSKYGLKNTKLSTMLFIAHSVAALINAGKVYFTQNPMAINYPQFMAFAFYLFKQLKFRLIEEPSLRNAYVNAVISDNLAQTYNQINKDFNSFAQNYTFILEGE